jgi:hypothetical protein
MWDSEHTYKFSGLPWNTYLTCAGLCGHKRASHEHFHLHPYVSPRLGKSIEAIPAKKYYMNFGDFMNSHKKVEDDHYISSSDFSKNILYLNG